MRGGKKILDQQVSATGSKLDSPRLSQKVWRFHSSSTLTHRELSSVLLQIRDPPRKAIFCQEGELGLQRILGRFSTQEQMCAQPRVGGTVIPSTEKLLFQAHPLRTALRITQSLAFQSVLPTPL